MNFPEWTRGLHPQLAPHFVQLVQVAQSVDPTVRVTSAKRSSTAQAALYRRYLAGVSRYPVAPPGRSKHEQGRAIDITGPDWLLRLLGEAWERAGGRWGGRFNDPIHFEA